MALSRFVLTATVTVAAGAATTGTQGWGNATTAGTAWSELWPVTFVKGQVIEADLTAGTTPPQLLYQAIGAGNLRAYVQGQDDVGHAALAN
jgi:hypothetical protein